jgi:hypothetical protein
MGRNSTERRLRRAFRVVLVGTLLLAAGCFAAPPPPPSAPSFPGYPVIPSYSGTQCKTALLIGDSLMTPINNVQDVLQQSGRCANVVNAASAPLPPETWKASTGPLVSKG